jgi:hypothetical protein
MHAIEQIFFQKKLASRLEGGYYDSVSGFTFSLEKVESLECAFLCRWKGVPSPRTPCVGL